MHFLQVNVYLQPSPNPRSGELFFSTMTGHLMLSHSPSYSRLFHCGMCPNIREANGPTRLREALYSRQFRNRLRNRFNNRSVSTERRQRASSR